MTTDAYVVSLDLEYEEEAAADDCARTNDGVRSVESAYVSFRPLVSKQTGEESYLRVPDRFFYNQVFYIHKDKTSYLEKNRYVGIAGREAFHVFDTELM